MLRQFSVAALFWMSFGNVVRAEVIDFDGVVAAAGGTLFPGNTFAGQGVTFTSGGVPNTLAVGDEFTLSDVDDGLLVLGNSGNISPPNFAAASQVLGGLANDLLMSFVSPITSVAVTTDDFAEPAADLIRLLALESTGNPLEFRVLALAEGLDNATSPPGNLLSVNFGGTPFSWALFQTISEPEGFDDLTFNVVPEPTSFLLAAFSGLIGFVVLRRRA